MEAFRELAGRDIPAAPVLDTLQVFNDPHFRQRGIVAEVEHPQRGRHWMVMCPVKMSGNDYTYRPAPLLGQHNEEVYAEWLGYSPEEVARLRVAGGGLAGRRDEEEGNFYIRSFSGPQSGTNGAMSAISRLLTVLKVARIYLRTATIIKALSGWRRNGPSEGCLAR